MSTKPDTADKPRRMVAIVGRPNVGKSALFNRIAGRRIAIVHEQEGVTRDRVACEAHWDDDVFELVDTGGIGVLDNARSKDGLLEATHRQVDTALSDAAVLIMVVDIQSGCTPLDQDMALRLRRSDRPVFLALNKTDADEHDEKGIEFESLGFPAFPVSALHNRGIGALMEEALKGLPPATAREDREALKVAVVGRPNAGKSSYINRLLRNDRVIVSDVPGTTRDSIDIPFSIGSGAQARDYVLTDTAGIKQRRKIKDPLDYFSALRAEKSIEHADVVVLAIDAEKGAGAQEKKIAGLIEKCERGSILLVTKWDLMKDTTQRAYTKELRMQLPFLGHVPIVYVSAEDGMNIRRSVDTIDYVGEQIRMTLGTGLLNRVLHDALERVQPPAVKGRRFKLFYAAQSGTRPIRIKCFVNDPKRLTDAYRRYLIQQLRVAFGLEGAPVILYCRRRNASRKK